MSSTKSTDRPALDGRGGGRPGHTFDTLDKKILDLLLSDSRTSAREISFKLGVSTSTVTARIERLRAGKILKGFTAMVDFQKLGYELTVVTEIIVSKGKLLE